MATTGFWPIKGNLKDAIKYAQNPDKTTKKTYLDEDLYNALKYVSNDAKTDKTMFVSSINCPKQLAYESMMSTKQRYGKLGGNVAYHGYQSFKIDEVTPEEAHNIGMATAKSMWGDEYEIIVTTHLNTENLHNHFVVNSVSSKTGRKFENHISDHYKLREISDRICKEHNKSVLENADFYGRNKKEYWAHKSGHLTHRDMLKRDWDFAIENSLSIKELQNYLSAMGYIFERGFDHKYPSVTTKDWKKPIRLSSLGEQYSFENITKRIEIKLSMEQITVYRQPPQKRYPIKVLEDNWFYTHKPQSVETAFINLIDTMLSVMVDLLTVCLPENYVKSRQYLPLSPELRAETRKLDKYQEEFKFVCKYEIKTNLQLSERVTEFKDNIKSLENDRQKLYNQIRREKNPDTAEILKKQCRDISAALKPIRKELKIAQRIEENLPKVRELLSKEVEMEKEILKQRSREYER